MHKSDNTRITTTTDSSNDAPQPLLVDRKQAAELLSCSSQLVINLQNAGHITGLKLSDGEAAQTFYELTEIRALIERRLREARERHAALIAARKNGTGPAPVGRHKKKPKAEVVKRRERIADSAS